MTVVAVVPSDLTSDLGQHVGQGISVFFVNPHDLFDKPPRHRIVLTKPACDLRI